MTIVQNQHQWSQALDPKTSSHTKIINNEILGGGDSGSANVDISFISVFEAEHIIKQLRSFKLEEIGSSSFLEMYGYDLERLSLQAHATARLNTSAVSTRDEFIVEGILSYGKLKILVETLLAIEVWRTFMLRSDNNAQSSSLAPLLAKNGNSLRCAFTLHAETTIIGILNLIFYHKESCEDMDSELAVALVDYCARNITSLSIPLSKNDMVRKQKEPLMGTDLMEHMKKRTSLDEIKENQLDTEFKISIAATSLARYLCEHIESLPLSAQTRILDTHDFLLMMVPLIDEPPWTRRRQKIIATTNNNNQRSNSVTIWEKYSDNHAWEEVQPKDLLQITKCEAQCWLAIFYLTCNSACRKQYGLTTFRKSQLLRLRKFLNELMCDQLPVLAEVMRYMDELSIMNVPESNSQSETSTLLLQQVALMRESIVQGKNWNNVISKQYEDIFSKTTDFNDEILRKISEIYSIDEIENVIGGTTSLQISQCGNETSSEILESVKLTVHLGYNDETNLFSFLLRPDHGDDPHVMNTPDNGLIQRIKLDFADKKRRLQSIIPSHASITLNIIHSSSSNNNDTVKVINCSDIDLPCIAENSEQSENKKCFASYDTLPALEWKQIGRIEDKIAVQIGFKKVSKKTLQTKVEGGSMADAYYILHTVFLSQVCC